LRGLPKSMTVFIIALLVFLNFLIIRIFSLMGQVGKNRLTNFKSLAIEKNKCQWIEKKD